MLSTVSAHSIPLECRLHPMRLVRRCSFDFSLSTGNWAKSREWVLFLKWAFFHAIWHQGVHNKCGQLL